MRGQRSSGSCKSPVNHGRCIRTAVICLVLGLAGSSAMAEVVVVVSSRSTLTALSRSQVVDVFLGKTRRFPDGKVAQPIDQLEGSATRREFYMRYADKTPAQLKAYWSKIIFTGRGQPPLALASALEVKKRLAASPAAISYIDRAQLDASVREIR